MSEAVQIPKVLMVQKPVDGGQTFIGVIECPYCGQTHYTNWIDHGQRLIFCGKGNEDAERADGWSTIDVVAVLSDNNERA